MAGRERVSRLAAWLEGHPTIKIVTITSALFAFLFDLGYEFVHVRPLQEEERRARFWEIIARPSPGNSGKTQALEYLNRQGVSMHGIDLSCERNGGEWTKRKPAYHLFDVQECAGGVYLQHADLPGVDLPNANLRGAWLDEGDLSGANLAGSNLRGAHLVRANLGNASLIAATANAVDFSFVNLKGANLEGADLFGSALVGTNLSFANLQKANFGNASLVGANLAQANLSASRLGYADLRATNLSNAILTDARLAKAKLNLANLTGATFEGAKELAQEQIDGAWAWQDTPAKDLPEGVEITRTCDPGENGKRRKEYEDLLRKGEASFANLNHCGSPNDANAATLPADLQPLPKPAKPQPAKPAWPTKLKRKLESLLTPAR